MHRSTFALSLALGLLLALPASANFQAKAKYTCYLSADGTTRLPTTKGKSEDLVAACLGVPEGDPATADYSLVFDSDTNALNVIRNCDSLVICTLTAVDGCSTATQPAFNGGGFKAKGRCAYDFLDVGTFDVKGSMSCRQSESNNENSGKFKFSASCNGDIVFDGVPCSIKVNTGKLFEESGTCPPAE